MQPRILLAGLLTAAMAVAWRPALTPSSNAITVNLGDGWATVPLPEMPLGVSSYKGTMWAVGANEMIAESSDAGRSWTVVHHYKPGEMLFFVAFLDDQNAVALGSGHGCLRSRDGGKTWKDDHSGKYSWQAGDFADASNGIAASPNGWGFTNDGGRTWELHGLGLPPDPNMKPPDPKAPLPAVPLLHSPNRQVLQIAALDGSRAAVLLAAEAGSQPWAFTKDGGKTWSVSGLFAGFKVTSMRASDGKFWLYGINANIGPTVMTSADMTNWDPNPALPAPYIDCRHQGCRLPGGWVQLDQPVTRLWQLPAELPGLSPTSWAASADAFCEVGDSKLVCAQFKTAWTSPPNSGSIAEVDYRDLKVERWAPVEQPQITYDSLGTDTHEGVTLVRMVLGANGRPESMQVIGAEWADLAVNVVDELKTWHFAPVIMNGKPAEAAVTVPYVFIASQSSRTNPGAPVASHSACCQ